MCQQKDGQGDYLSHESFPPNFILIEDHFFWILKINIWEEKITDRPFVPRTTSLMTSFSEMEEPKYKYGDWQFCHLFCTYRSGLANQVPSVTPWQDQRDYGTLRSMGLSGGWPGNKECVEWLLVEHQGHLNESGMERDGKKEN